MKLSVELFQRTVQQLKGESVGQRADKRLAPRVGLRARIQLKLVRGGGLGAPIEVWTRDISRVGLGIIHSKKLKTGDHYFLSLPREDEDDREKSLALYCTVRCSHELAPGTYSIGLTFEDMRTKQFPAARQSDNSENKIESPISTKKPAISAKDEQRIRNAILS